MRTRLARVALVFFRQLGRKGKMDPEFFIPIFRRVLATYDISVEEFWADDLPSQLERYRNQAIILVYAEVQAALNPDLAARIAQIEDVARQYTENVLHGLSLGLCIADKLATNRTLSAAGVPMPKVIRSAFAPACVFSNHNCSSAAPVELLEAGSKLDPDRYNTEFIDTTQMYQGRPYFLALRARCVGSDCVSIYVRARLCEEGDAYVASKYTPLNPDLLNYFFARVVFPREIKIRKICDAIASTLGIGFYAHDILPSNHSDDLYVCETGFKFDDHEIRMRFAPLGDKVPFNDHVSAITASAHSFVRAIVKGTR